MKRRTLGTRATTSLVVCLAAEYLEHPSMTVLPGKDHPKNVARALYHAERKLSEPGPVRGRREVINNLQDAADYLSHRDVPNLPSYTEPTRTVAKMLSEVVRDLK